jgi:hypothetical protein
MILISEIAGMPWGCSSVFCFHNLDRLHLRANWDCS